MRSLQLLLLLLFCSQNIFIKAQVDDSKIRKHVEILASDLMKGRLVGSDGEKLAAEYIANYFQDLKLTPLLDNQFIKTFSFKYSSGPHGSSSDVEEITGRNVVAFLDNGAKYTFIIGGHFDHLGLNEYNLSTDTKGKGEIHNGADDNTSGVAAVLELANIYSNNNITEPVNFIFACFSGEELGLMGSKSLAEIIKKEFPNSSFMINFDMIGRMDSNNQLNIGGVGTSTDFTKILNDNKPATFQITLDESGTGPSDHTSFYINGIPVLFFHTGLHLDYHKPTDDADKINYNKTAEIVEFAKSVIDQLAKNPELPFLQTKMKANENISTFKVTLGIFPDYKDYGDGLHIQEVIENRTAEKYGLKKGDIITKIHKTEITDVYTYMTALSTLKKDIFYKLKFIRNKKTNTIKIKF